MGELLRYLRRLLVIIVTVLLVALVALILFARTAKFNQLVQAQLAPYLATTFKGTIEIGVIKGSLWGDLELHDVILRYAGADVLRIPRVEIGYRLLPLLWRSLHLRVHIFDPVGAIVRDRSGHWNLLEALSAQKPRPPSAPGSSPMFALMLDPVTISDGVIEVTPGPGTRYRLLHLATDIRTALTIAGLDVNVRTLDMTVATPQKPSAELQAVFSYKQTGAARAVDLTDLRLQTEHSALAASGTIELAAKPEVKARVSLTRLAVTDLAVFAPAVPLRADLSGKIDVAGPTNALHTTVALAAAGATLALSAQTDVTTTPPAYSGTLKLDSGDLEKLMRAPGFAGMIGTELTAQGQGFTIDTISGRGKLWGRNLLVAKHPLGTTQAAADLAGGNLRANGSVRGPAGAVTIGGTASLASDSRYRFKLTTRRLDFAKLGSSGTVATNLNLDATVDGHGLNVAQLETRIGATLSPSQIAGATLNSGIVDARIARGQAHIARARFAFEGANLALQGTGGFAPGTQSNLVYSVNAASLARLFKRARVNGDGRLQVSGIVRGPQEHLRTNGTIRFSTLHAVGYTVEAGQIRYDLAASGNTIPTGSVTAQLDKVRLGVDFPRLILAVTMPPARRGTIMVKLNAINDQGHNDRLTLALDYRPPAIAGHLDEVAIALPDGTWRLAAPVSFQAKPGNITLGQFRMQNGERKLSMAGSLSHAGAQTFSLDLAQIDPVLLGPLLPHAQRYAGSLSGNLRLSGTAAQPHIELQATVSNVAVDKRRVGNLALQLALRDSRARLDATLREDPANVITAAGTISASVNWTRGFNLRTGDDLDLHVFAPQVDLARLAVLALDTLQDFHGAGAFDLRLQGAVTRPMANGNIRVAGVKGEIVPLGVKLTEAHARIDLDSEQVKITTFAAQAAGGSITATGAIALTGYALKTIEITVKFDHWPAIATPQYQAVIGGELDASGSLAAPRAGGRIEVLNGTIRPDLAFLAASSQLTPDETITVIASGQSAPAPVSSQSVTPPVGAPTQPSRFNNLAIDLTVQIDRNTWIRHEQAQTELEGKVQISKDPQGPVRMVGAINTVRGWIIYQQHRFDLQSGEIAFTGGQPIDPTLNIDARYTLPDYLIDVVVSGTAHQPVLQLKSQPDLPQADILSLIMFGKTTAALGQGEQQSLQEQAMRMAGGYAAGQIGQAVTQSLGFDALGLQLSDVSTTGGAVGFGRYIGANTYVSASEGIGGQGRTVSIQYFLWRWLSVTTSTSSNGGSGINLNLRRQY